ncbi:MAG: FGGY family carbohydrate kinase [Candidatus Bathyarchaeia archaeon]
MRALAGGERNLYLMGIDVGSTVCKAAIYDADGSLISIASKEYENLFFSPQEEWCEYNPENLWNIVCECIRKSIQVAKVNPEDIKALSVSVSGESIIPLGRDGRPAYNGINWTDRRSNSYKPEREKLENEVGALKVYEITGYPINPVPSSVKMLWFKYERPDVYRKVWKFMLWEDYINWKLTGKAALSYSTASSSQLFDIRRKKWSEEVLSSLDISPDILSECLPSGSVIGEVLPEASKETSLSKRTVVAAGGWDQSCGALGAGTIYEGETCNTTGTVECITPVVRKPILNEETLSAGFYCSPYFTEDSYVYFAWFPTSGAILKWFKDNFANKEIELANVTGKDIYDVLVDMAAQSVPGANGLLLLPFFEGSGAGQPPTFNIDARGALIGLRLSHGKGDIVRAILEGVAFQTRIIIEKVESLGIRITELKAIGGGAKSKLWMQIKADITGKKIILPDVIEAGTLGAAMLAGVADKVYQDLAQAVKKACRVKGEFYPRSEVTNIYKKIFDVYKDLYPTFLPIFAKMAAIK